MTLKQFQNLLVSQAINLVKNIIYFEKYRKNN